MHLPLLHTPTLQLRCTAPARSCAPRFTRTLPRISTVCSAEATDAPSAKPPRQQMLVYVPPHPLVKHWLAIVRNSMSPTPVFRKSMAELGRILIYEAVRDWLPTVNMDVPTPMGTAEATVIDPSKPVKVCWVVGVRCRHTQTPPYCTHATHRLSQCCVLVWCYWKCQRQSSHHR